jgi:hypothetical protein
MSAYDDRQWRQQYKDNHWQRVEALLTEIRDALVAKPPENMPKSMSVAAPYDPLAPRPPYPPMSEAMLGYDAQLATAMPLPPARPAGSLHVSGPNGELPDPIGTPGAVQEGVTAAMILAPGYTTKSVRPPTSYTDALKIQQMREYNLAGDPSLYEEDHLVPLECAGHPTSPDNLWPQLRTGDFGARVKDLTENAARAALASGAMSLQEIQDGFKSDWTKLHAKLFTNPKVVGALMATAMEPPSDEP